MGPWDRQHFCLAAMSHGGHVLPECRLLAAAAASMKMGMVQESWTPQQQVKMRAQLAEQRSEGCWHHLHDVRLDNLAQPACRPQSILTAGNVLPFTCSTPKKVCSGQGLTSRRKPMDMTCTPWFWRGIIFWAAGATKSQPQSVARCPHSAGYSHHLIFC